MIRKLFHITLLMISFHMLSGQQLNFDVTGTWNYNIPPGDIIEAGNDFTGNYASDPNQVEVDIYLSGGWIGFWWNYFINYSWQVEISKIDIDWDPNLDIYIRRTGNGAGYGGGNFISGGNTYMEISNVNQQFFQGSRARLNVPIQYEIRNVSVTIPAKTYSTTIVYTITSTF